MKEILELMAKNFPCMPVLMVYDDKSGRLLKDGTESAYDEENVYFTFRSIEELKEKLSAPSATEVYEDTLLDLEGDAEDSFPF